jgi:hypothetical protein
MTRMAHRTWPARRDQAEQWDEPVAATRPVMAVRKKPLCRAK